MNAGSDNYFEFSDDNKRYHTYNYYLKKRFGCKVMKIPLNANFGCPNRDGTKGVGGCKFCSAQLSGEFAGDPHDDIPSQFKKVRAIMNNKWSDGLYIPYFQSGSNTYAPVQKLREIFEAALELADCVGLSVATRADCIDEEKAALLGELSKRTYLTVELGLQTIHDKTALAMNRCHTYADFLKGYELLRKNGVNVCVHIINGLPGETHDMMLETARELAGLELHGIKIHLLHIIKGTPLEQLYQRGEFAAMQRQEYVNIVCDQLEVFPKELIIERVTGDGAKDELVAPLWSLKKFCVINEIDKELCRRNSYQGIRFER